MSVVTKPAKSLAGKLFAGLAAFSLGPAVLDANREIIMGVTPQGVFVGGMTAQHFIAKATKISKDSGRVYRWGNSICFDRIGDQGRELVTLSIDHRAEPTAAHHLANLFHIGVVQKSEVSQSFLPASLSKTLLADESFWRSLPVVKHYSRRAVFCAEFTLCKPGWNPDSGILVHAEPIDPYLPELGPCEATEPMERLPPNLKKLLQEFDWRSPSDMVNAVALMLTGLLINHFIDEPHPVAIVDGNQPGLGKTILVQAIGRVLDGFEPTKIVMTNDEELEKRLGALIRSSAGSLVMLDNVRARIESAVLEQNVLSPKLSFRILGESNMIERPNGLLWVITSNSASGTPDFIRRSIPIRLYHEGDPKKRKFEGNPLRYAIDHRTEILGELAGMVCRWVQNCKPVGSHTHRCDRWAATLGGILDSCGLGGSFLTNLEEAEAEMDEGLQDLAALAENVAKGPGEGFCSPAGKPRDNVGRNPGDWLTIFTGAEVMKDELYNGNQRAKATRIGKFMAARVNRDVVMSTADGPKRATLLCRDGRARQKFYWFEIADADNCENASASSVPVIGRPNSCNTPDADPAPTATHGIPYPQSAPAVPTTIPEATPVSPSGREETRNITRTSWF